MDGQIVVVGAGIAGLTVAAALARAGVECQVYERAGQPGTAGAGIQLSPNGVALLHRLGLGERLAAVASRPAAIELRRWDDNAVLATTPLDECPDRFGAPYYTLHRRDLHRALLDLVGERARRGHCVALHPRESTVDVEFADGTRVGAGLVIGADGVHSAVRQLLVADEPRFTGVTVYRGLVPAARLPHRMADPRVVIWLGPGRHCVSYPAGAFISFVATVPDPAAFGRRSGARTESWVEPGQVAELVRAYAGWHPEVGELLAAAPSVTRWALHDRAPLTRWTTDRVALVGDAAHAMLPFGGQGANQAVEDAFALVACLDRGEDALPYYEKVRLPRIAQISAVVEGHSRDHHLDDGAHQQARDGGLAARRALDEQAWLYGYDAEREARER